MEEQNRAVQADLFSLLPGVKGGRALTNQRGRSYMQAIGRAGGIATRDRYGVAYLRELGRIGRQVRRDRHNHSIRVIEFLPGIYYKVIPYFPTSHRRKHPMLVCFYLSDAEEESQ